LHSGLFHYGTNRRGIDHRHRRFSAEGRRAISMPLATAPSG